jgi:hypothetical protein
MRAAPDAREHLYLALWSAFTRTVFEALVCRIRIRLPTEHVAVGAHGLGRGTRAHKISKTKPRTGSRRGSQLQFTTKVVACLPALVIRRERLRRVTWFTWVTRIDATSNPLTASCKRAVDDRPFSSSSWLSTLALKTRGKVQLRSRNDNDFTARYPEIAKALAPCPMKSSAMAKLSRSIHQAGRLLMRSRITAPHPLPGSITSSMFWC